MGTIAALLGIKQEQIPEIDEKKKALLSTEFCRKGVSTHCQGEQGQTVSGIDLGARQWVLQSSHGEKCLPPPSLCLYGGTGRPTKLHISLS